MKYTTYVALSMLGLIMFVTPACDWLKKREAQIEEPPFRLIDVNTDEIYADARIPGSIHMGLEELENTAKNWGKETLVVTFCSDYYCMQSHLAAKKLKELGFTNVKVYAGGIHEWYKLSQKDKEIYPLEGKATMAFLSKEVEKVLPEKEEGDVISAEEVAQWLEQIRK